LRAIAVASVVLFHSGLSLFRGGFVGVDIFFVISGYLIGGIVYRDVAAGQFDFARFYARRLRRIMPALLVVVLSSCVAALLLLNPVEARRFGVSAASAILGTSNIRFFLATGYFAPDARLDPMLMTWSLGVEEQFYIFAPALILVLHRIKASIVLPAIAGLVLVSFAASVVLSPRLPSFAFYLIPTRAWELGAGVMLALVEQRRSRLLTGGWANAASILGLILGVGTIFLLPESVPYPGIAAALPVSATLLLLASPSGTANRNFLSSAPMRMGGLVSYSWYLWHWPLDAFIRICSPFGEPRLALLLVFPLSFCIAYFSYRFVEQPFRHSKTPMRPLFMRYAAVTAAVIAVPFALVASKGAPIRFSPEIARAAFALERARSSNCVVSFEVQQPNLSAACSKDSTSGSSIAVVGDSHAGALGPGVISFAEGHSMGYRIYSKSSCRPLLGVSVWRRDHPRLVDTCASFMRTALDRIEADPSVRYVILSGLWGALLFENNQEAPVPLDGHSAGINRSSLLRLGLTRTIASLRRAGKKVILAEDVPHWKFNPAEVVVGAAMPLRAFAAGLDKSTLIGQAPIDQTDDYVPAANSLVATVARETGATLLPTYTQFCDQRSCTFARSGRSLFIDNSHVNDEGARLAMKSLAEVLD
jgi:peptidoglycan/LPS O-acetylase OafA/YrhL